MSGHSPSTHSRSGSLSSTRSHSRPILRDRSRSEAVHENRSNIASPVRVDDEDLRTISEREEDFEKKEEREKQKQKQTKKKKTKTRSIRRPIRDILDEKRSMSRRPSRSTRSPQQEEEDKEIPIRQVDSMTRTFHSRSWSRDRKHGDDEKKNRYSSVSRERVRDEERQQRRRIRRRRRERRRTRSPDNERRRSRSRSRQRRRSSSRRSNERKESEIIDEIDLEQESAGEDDDNEDEIRQQHHGFSDEENDRKIGDDDSDGGGAGGGVGGAGAADGNVSEPENVCVPIDPDNDDSLEETIEKWGPPQSEDNMDVLALYVPNPAYSDETYWNRYHDIASSYTAMNKLEVCKAMKMFFDSAMCDEEHPELTLRSVNKHLIRYQNNHPQNSVRGLINTTQLILDCVENVIKIKCPTKKKRRVDDPHQPQQQPAEFRHDVNPHSVKMWHTLAKFKFSLVKEHDKLGRSSNSAGGLIR